MKDKPKLKDGFLIKDQLADITSSNIYILSSRLNDKKRTFSDMSVESLESPGVAFTSGPGLTGLPGDCTTGLIGEDLLDVVGVCNIEI